MAKILITDDEPDILESLNIMLQAAGYDVVTASSGKEALSAAATSAPDLVILDVMMPEMDGYQVCKALKRDLGMKNTPVLLLTAIHQVEDKVKGLDAGADDFITKPFIDEELKARVRAFLRTKKLQDELQVAYQQLRELEQMRDSLTHMLVHDLKGPLTGIQGGVSAFLLAIESQDQFPSDLKQVLVNSRKGCQKLLILIQDILDVSRLEENRLPVVKKPVHMVQLVRSTLQLLEPFPSEVEVKFEVVDEATLPHVPLDENLFERVLVNLVTNSLKFTSAGGCIAVRVKHDAEKNEVECRVSDTGTGIPKDSLGKIFDKFFQADDASISRKGQGLGLFFCKLAVESHGGRIWAESEPGRGSQFFLRFPI